MKEKTRNAIIEYYEKFGEIFPTEVFPGTEDEIPDTIAECINKNKRYEELADIDMSKIY